MTGLRITRYEEQHKKEWDSFVLRSKNGVFMFRRTFMEYHEDRFVDHSLMFFEGNKLVGLLPANIKEEEGILSSHSGLTFGGIIADHKMKTIMMLQLFEALLSYLRNLGVKKIIYKTNPNIYSTIPSEEDLYALFRNGFKLITRNISSCIFTNRLIPAFSKGRKHSMKKAINNSDLRMERSEDFKGFMDLMNSILKEKYDSQATHTFEEISYLNKHFPENIILYNVYYKDELAAGTILFESRQVVHTQYIASSDDGKYYGALDFLFHNLFTEVYKDKPVFDFGTSNENGGLYLNESLIKNKESYGARAVAYDIYELIL